MKEQTPEVTMLAQTGVTLKISSRKHSQKLRKSVRRRSRKIEDSSANVQQSMHFHGRFEEGQEHTGVECDIDEIEKFEGHDEVIEMEIYANHLGGKNYSK